MNLYSDLLISNKLFSKFDELANFEDVSASEIGTLKELLKSVAEKAGPHLDRIRITFPQYTEHDMRHVLNVADNIHQFLPGLPEQAEGKEIFALNGIELTILFLAILLHDVGMFVSDANEKQDLLDSDEYRVYLRHAIKRLDAAKKAEDSGLTVRASVIREAIFAEFIRRKHAERVKEYIVKNLKDTLRFRDSDFSSEIANLCASHAWGIHESNDPRKPDLCVKKLDMKKMIGRTPVNLSYIACCLRLGDILDFDRTRTPLSAFHDIHFTEDMSIQEWNKHLSIEGIDINQYRVLFDTKCKTPSDYVAVHNFLDWVDKELQECTRLVRQYPDLAAKRYKLNIAPLADRTQVRMENPDYIAGAFRFQLDYDQIIRLLMDKSLYPDPALFLRELLQNALDACRYQKALAQDNRMDDKYIPRIQVQDLSGLPRDPARPLKGPRIIFRDNGIGMSQEQVENYFMRVGKSFYRSVEFKAEVERLKEKGIFLDACSRFGIGFLSCFMGGDLIEVVTYRHGCQPLKITIEGPGKYFLIERLHVQTTSIPYNSPEDPDEDTPPYYPGTCVTVHLRDNWHEKDNTEFDDLVFKTLNAFAVNQEFPISIMTASSQESRIIAARRWENETPFPKIRDYHQYFDKNDLETIKQFLAPTIFHFTNMDPMLHGIGVIWMLSNDRSPIPRKGNLLFRNTICEANFISNVHNFLLSVLEGYNLLVKDRDEIICATEMLIQSQNEAWEMFEKLNKTYKNLFIQIDYKNLKHIFSDLNIAEKKWFLTLVQNMLKNLPLYIESIYKNNKLSMFRELSILATGDLDLLAKVWLHEGLTGWKNLDIPNEYHIAFHGIEAPGGFQSWQPATGTATRHGWLPDGTSALIDTYGSLSPQPSASRLFVPLEQSIDIQDRVTRAFIRHADKLRKEHADCPEWQTWFRDFLRSWKNNVLYSAICSEDFILIVDSLTIENKTEEEGTKLLTIFELCHRFDIIAVYRYLYADDFGFEDVWWLPGFLDAEYDNEEKREVDLAPLAARLGIKKP